MNIEIHPVSDLTAEQKRAKKTATKFMREFFAKQRKKIADDIAFAYSKTGKSEADDRAAEIIAAISLDEWDVVAKEFEALTGPTFEQTAEIVLGKLGITDPDIFNLVSEASVDFAEEAAADLVTSITETTRERLKSEIVDAIENASGVKELRAAIESNFAFSRERAEMVARTEIGNAHMGGALEAAKQSGLQLRKSIVRGSQDFDCIICEPNELEGQIELDALFLSGDEGPLFHPNCECTLIFTVVKAEQAG